jgi:amino acid adenylation domain-containing protein
MGELMVHADASLPEILAVQAARFPGVTAIGFDDDTMTYAELDERASQVGRYLAGLGVGPDVVVGLLVERSLDMIVGLLGILMAGGAYLPLDADLPHERLSLILQDAKPRVILTQRALAGRLAGRDSAIVCYDRDSAAIAAGSRLDLGSRTHPGNLAYVIYTSGSTGVPKGIMITHGALKDRVLAKTSLYGFGPGDRILQFSGLSFDAAGAEIFPTLLAGATLVVHPRPSWTSAPELLAECERRGVTGVMLSPVYMQLVVDALTESGQPAPWLRYFITGGENLPVERLAALARLLPHRPRFVYAYGPTETTIAATLYVPSLDPVEIERLDKVPIGAPMPGTEVYILDAERKLVETGQVGELYIAGTGLARGYLGRPALTADRFVPCELGGEPGARMYRTGDLARRTAAGDLEFAGRVDTQVKIRGFRVELGDVENAVAQHPGISHVTAVSHDGRLVAYCVPGAGPRPAASDLREFVGKKLPEYMVPSVFMLLESMPLTTGGKVDQRALPEPREEGTDGATAGGEPDSPIAKLLAEIWCGLLGRDHIGTDENFFDAGGNSLLANQVVSRVRNVLGVDVPLRAIFLAPTISELASSITASSVAAGGSQDMLDLLADLEQMPDEDMPDEDMPDEDMPAGLDGQGSQR